MKNSVLAALALLSCAPAYTPSGTKLVGVGYDPEAIGPAPDAYGGVVEYSWLHFAGGGLSLAMMQLAAYDEVGPAFATFAPPYAAVYGFSYLFSERLTAADSLGGITAVPPEVEETCYTTFEATGPIGSFTTVDVGSSMHFAREDGSPAFTLDRIPAEYPLNRQDAFAYYFAFDFWSPTPLYGKVRGSTDKPSDMLDVLLRGDNFPFGRPVSFAFPGGFTPAYAPLASLPRPSAAVDNDAMVLPQAPGPVQLEWDGPRYDAWGTPGEDGEQRTCLSFAPPDGDPRGPGDCIGAESKAGATHGQLYTGPWDTTDGRVTLRWTPGTGADEAVSFSVRFLGPIDRSNPSFQEEVIRVQPDEAACEEWTKLQPTDADGQDYSIPDGVPIPTGRRAPSPCEDGADWEFDDDFLDADGEFIPALRGDPNHNVAEVTCRLRDDGEFVLTDAIVEEALTYARAHGAEGAEFYFARSTSADFEVSAAMDRYGQRLDITPIKLASRAIDAGRFWLEE
jgi:hypothetical protein